MKMMISKVPSKLVDVSAVSLDAVDEEIVGGSVGHAQEQL